MRAHLFYVEMHLVPARVDDLFGAMEVEPLMMQDWRSDDEVRFFQNPAR